MAIDYLLEVKCEPQQALGAEKLVELHRTRVLARSALLHMREDGDQREPQEIAIQLTMRNPGGDSARGVTLQDLLNEAAPLDRVSDACKTCPAELHREFACHRRIRYPIPERVEEWLMARLPVTLQCAAGALLVRGLAEFNWDGAPTAKLRAAGTTFFESRVAYGVRWQAEDGSTIEMSSDQLFQMMFLVGQVDPTTGHGSRALHLRPPHCLMLALFTGVIPHDTSLHDLKEGPGRQRVLAGAHVDPHPDPEIEQLAAFLRMLAVAARLDLPILVDG
ncbi:MAG: hypothetical protein ABI467_32265 [Kofleriaceae bacterium]